MAKKQWRTQPMFEITDAATNRGVLNPSIGAGFAEAAMLRGRHEITKMPKLDGTRSFHSHRYTPARSLFWAVGTCCPIK
jgi:hypothetical protein